MNLELLVIHCTATPEGRVVMPSDIWNWHTSPVSEGGRGWKQVGYSDMILLDGSLVNLVPYDEDNEVEPWEITNGVAGINSKSRHIVYVGGTDKKGKAKDTRTIDQRITMLKYINKTIDEHPLIKIAGHNQFALKACPSFDVPQWLRYNYIDAQNIYQSPTV
jgi:N-acetylmuramoyl-L-alanine amidase